MWRLLDAAHTGGTADICVSWGAGNPPDEWTASLEMFTGVDQTTFTSFTDSATFGDVDVVTDTINIGTDEMAIQSNTCVDNASVTTLNTGDVQRFVLTTGGGDRSTSHSSTEANAATPQTLGVTLYSKTCNDVALKIITLNDEPGGTAHSEDLAETVDVTPDTFGVTGWGFGETIPVTDPLNQRLSNIHLAEQIDVTDLDPATIRLSNVHFTEFVAIRIGQPEISNQLVSWTSLDQHTNDYEGNDNTGTWTGGATYNNTVLNYTGTFDGSTQFVTLAVESDYDFDITNPYSMSAWIRTTGTGDMTIFSKRDGLANGNEGFSLTVTSNGDIRNDLSNGALEFHATSLGGAGPDPDVRDGRWHHVVGTFEGNSDRDGLRVYIDGIFEGVGLASGISGETLTDHDVIIGATADSNNFFDGEIQEVKVWSRELTALEVLEEFGGADLTAFHSNIHLAETIDVTPDTLTTRISSIHLAEQIDVTDLDPMNVRLSNIHLAEQIDVTDLDPANIRLSNIHLTEYIGVRIGQPEITDQLVAHISLDQHTNDYAGNDNTGTWTGTELYENSVLNYTGDFDGSSYVTLAVESDFDFDNTNPFSVSYWARTSDTNEQWIVAKDNFRAASDTGWLAYITSSGRYAFQIIDGTNINNVNTVTDQDDGIWHHLVSTYSGNSDRDGMKLYLDGVLVDTGTSQAIGSILNNLDVVVGAQSDGGLPFNGQLQEVKIFSKELTANEVLREFGGDNATLVHNTGATFSETLAESIPVSDVISRDRYDIPWGSVKKLTIQASDFDAIATNYPLLVNITDSDMTTVAQSDCDDFVFMDENNMTKLDHEIEQCDLTGNDWIEMWVKIPSVDSTTNTIIYMYYGNSGAIDQQFTKGNLPVNVWRSEYEMVLHLNGTFLDSTSNGQDFTNSGTTVATDEYIGDSRNWDGDNDRLFRTTDADLDNIFDGGGTMSVWLNPNSDGEGDNARVVSWDNTGGLEKFVMHVSSESGGSMDIRFNPRFSGVNGYWGTTALDIDIDKWQLWIVTYDGDATANNPIFYIDGVKKEVGSGLTEIASPTGTRDVYDGVLTLGNFDTLIRTWDGEFDEWRFYDGIVTDAWAKADWECQRPDNSDGDITVNDCLAHGTQVSFGNTVLNLPESIDVNDVLQIPLFADLPESIDVTDVLTTQPTLAPFRPVNLTASLITSTEIQINWNDPKNWTLAVIGDFGIDNADSDRVATEVRSWNPDLILTTGDNNYELGEASTIDVNIGEEWSAFIANYTGSFGSGRGDCDNDDCWRQVDPINQFYPTLGNHDLDSGTPVGDAYFDYLTLPRNEFGTPDDDPPNPTPYHERYWNFTQSDGEEFVIGFVGLNMQDDDPTEPDGDIMGSEQNRYFNNTMGNYTNMNTEYNFVSFHYPAYSSGTPTADYGNTPDFQWDYADRGITAVFQSHAHHYERLSVDETGSGNTIPYFVNGLGGHSFFTSCGSGIPESQFLHCEDDHGAMRVSVNYTSVYYEFIHDDGTGPPPTFFLLDSLLVPSDRALITGYQIDRRICDGSWSTIVADTGSRTTEYNDPGLSTDTCYDYRVSPINVAGIGNMSQTAQAITALTEQIDITDTFRVTGWGFGETIPITDILTADLSGSFSETLTEIVDVTPDTLTARLSDIHLAEQIDVTDLDPMNVRLSDIHLREYIGVRIGQPEISRGLVSWSSLDQHTNDYQRSGESGTWIGTEAYQNSVLNYTGDFNGGDAIDLTTESSFDFERTVPFSLSAWVISESLGLQEVIAGKKQSGVVPGWNLRINAGDNLVIEIEGDDGDRIFTSFANNIRDDPREWHHVGFTYDGSSNRLGVTAYVDGVALPLGTSQSISTSILNDVPFTIGARGNNAFFWNGQIQEVKVWSVELTANEMYEEFSGADLTAFHSNIHLAETVNVTPDTLTASISNIHLAEQIDVTDILTADLSGSFSETLAEIVDVTPDTLTTRISSIHLTETVDVTPDTLTITQSHVRTIIEPDIPVTDILTISQGHVRTIIEPDIPVTDILTPRLSNIHKAEQIDVTDVLTTQLNTMGSITLSETIDVTPDTFRVTGWGFGETIPVTDVLTISNMPSVTLLEQIDVTDAVSFLPSNLILTESIDVTDVLDVDSQVTSFNAIFLYCNVPTTGTAGCIYAGTCPVGQYSRGYDANGYIICEVLP